MRSEAIVIVYLQKTKDARRIYATYVYGRYNCNGFRQEGIMQPTFSTQKNLLDEFYDECNVIAQELSYIEAHATGTVLGDVVEVDSIDKELLVKKNYSFVNGFSKIKYWSYRSL